MPELSEFTKLFPSARTSSGRERRVARRMNCTGDAEVNHIDGSPVFRGKVQNLSLTGCRIRPEGKSPLESGTEVEIVLEVNSIRFRVVGAVRSEDSDTGIGLEFLKLSRRCEAYVRELIQELEDTQKEPRRAS